MSIYNPSRVINMDAGAKCTLECPSCIRQKSHHYMDGDWITIDQIKLLSSFFEKITMCGNISDPMVHPDLPPILRYLYENNIEAEIHTAASQKKEEYWRECFAAHPKARWVFGLDGLPHKSHLYRINQDGEKLFEMMLIAKYEYDIRVTWNHIIFDYNQDDLEEVKELAARHMIELGIKKSGRFYSEDDPYLPRKGNFLNDRLETTKKATAVAKEKGVEVVEAGKELLGKRKLIPKCRIGKSTKAYGHCSTGYLLPCCWTDKRNKNQEKMEGWDKFKQPHLHFDNVESIEEILDSEVWQDFFDMLDNHPEDAPWTCKKYCSFEHNIANEVNYEKNNLQSVR